MTDETLSVWYTQAMFYSGFIFGSFFISLTVLFVYLHFKNDYSYWLSVGFGIATFLCIILTVFFSHQANKYNPNSLDKMPSDFFK